MADEPKTLSDLGELAGEAGITTNDGATQSAPVYEQKLDAYGRAYATGKRKNAVARVWIKPGPGRITVNGKEFEAYFSRPVLQMILKQPLVAAARLEQFDVMATVAGGGLSGHVHVLAADHAL